MDQGRPVRAQNRANFAPHLVKNALDIEKLWVRILLSASIFFEYEQLFNHKNLSLGFAIETFHCVSLFSFEMNTHLRIIYIIYKKNGW